MNTDTTTLSPEQNLDSETILTEVKGGWAEIKALPAALKTLQTETTKTADDLAQVRRLISSRNTQHATRAPGLVTDDCASHLMAQLIAHYCRTNRTETLASVPSQRDAVLSFAARTLDLSTRAALSTTEVPLPTQYAGQLRELISDFGVVRRCMFPYPIGMGTAKPARMGSRPAFGSIAMSGAFPEKVPNITFASLESHKVGGVVRLPREIDEQSIVPMGQFLARYGAIEFARAEDTWGFIADGTPNYEGVLGIVQTAQAKNTALILPTGKTKPSDATLDDFRNLRLKVNKAALSGKLSAYYLDSTWEAHLPTFRTPAEQNIYQRLPDGSAILDGYPIVWTDVLQPYGTVASPSSPLAVFGALSFWWFGEHGQPRMDNSDQVYFANDQLAVRFIEEIDFDYAASDATAALLTAAS